MRYHGSDVSYGGYSAGGVKKVPAQTGKKKKKSGAAKKFKKKNAPQKGLYCCNLPDCMLLLTANCFAR